MRRIALIFAVLLATPLIHAEDADAVREQGIAALKDSQTNPRSIVNAARLFVKAAELYNAAGDEEKNVEMNSFLYWCKKKMTMEDIDAFTKGGEIAISTKLAAVEKAAPKVEDAQKWFDRAEQFAKKNPDEHLLVAIRFYEVADRFKGHELSMQAQDRSLKEILLDKNNAVKVATPVKVADTAANTHDKRLVPSADELKKSEKLIKDLLKADYAKTDAASRQALITKLLHQADENKADPAAEYVLLEEARDLAVITGDSARAVATQKRITDSFKIDRAAMLLELKKLESSAKTADPAAALATVLMQGSEEALAAGDYDQAVRYNSRAEDLQIYIKVVELKTRMKAEIARAQTLKRESVAALAAQKTLETKPDDPEANLIFGKFALMLGDVEKSMPMLSKGKDPVLSGLAKLELNPPTEATEQAKLADGWFERAEKESALVKTRMQERAALWYTTAMPGLAGLQKLKVEGRMKSLMPGSGTLISNVAKQSDNSRSNTGKLYVSCDSTVDIMFNDKVIGKSGQHGQLSSINIELQRGDSLFFISKNAGGRVPGVSWVAVNEEQRWYIASSKSNTLGVAGKLDKAANFATCVESAEWVYNSLWKRLPENIKILIKKPEGLEAVQQENTKGQAVYKWTFDPDFKIRIGSLEKTPSVASQASGGQAPAKPAGPPTELNWTNLAEVNFEGAKATFIPLVEGEIRGSHGKTVAWGAIPAWLAGRSYTLKADTTDAKAVLSFSVVKDGLVLIACSPRWGGGGGGGAWQADIKKRADFIADGWQELGSIPASDGSAYPLFLRMCKKGEAFNLRTEKYTSPFLIK